MTNEFSDANLVLRTAWPTIPSPAPHNKQRPTIIVYATGNCKYNHQTLVFIARLIPIFLADLVVYLDQSELNSLFLCL